MKKLLGKLSIITIAISCNLIILVKPSESQQSGNKYECIDKNGIPTTIVTTQRGVVELIKWKSIYFSDSNWTPEKRCQAVTDRFQAHSDAGSLRYITYGEMNNQNVICVADPINRPKQPYKCKENNINVDNRTYDSILLTLEKEDNPGEILQELFNLSLRVSTGGITRSAANKYPTFVDLDKILQELSAAN